MVADASRCRIPVRPRVAHRPRRLVWLVHQVGGKHIPLAAKSARHLRGIRKRTVGAASRCAGQAVYAGRGSPQCGRTECRRCRGEHLAGSAKYLAPACEHGLLADPDAVVIPKAGAGPIVRSEPAACNQHEDVAPSSCLDEQHEHAKVLDRFAAHGVVQARIVQCAEGARRDGTVLSHGAVVEEDSDRVEVVRGQELKKAVEAAVRKTLDRTVLALCSEPVDPLCTATGRVSCCFGFG